jgi:hypothetical protein
MKPKPALQSANPNFLLIAARPSTSLQRIGERGLG